MSDPRQIEHLAALARLELDPDERDEPGDQIERILGFVEQLRQVDVDGVVPTSHAGEAVDVRRDDEPRPSLPRDEVLDAAPEVHDGHFAVPRVLPGSGDA